MAKTLSAFRLSDHTNFQLAAIQKIDIEKSKRTGTVPKNRTEIVEEAIENYYLQLTDSEAGDPYISKMEVIISNLLKRYFDSFLTAINANHMDVLEEKEYLKCIMKGFKFPETDQAAREFLYMPSVYTDLITRKVMEDAQKEIDEEQR